MVKIKKRNQVPPGGWRFKDDSSFWVEAKSIDGLVSNVILHRQRNKSEKSLDPEEVEQEVLTQICSMLDDSWCKGARVRYDDKTRYFKLKTITSLTNVALELAKDMDFVDLGEMSRRSAICNKCFLNKPAQGCACAAIYKTINKALPENRRNEDLHMCGACGCMINAKVQLKPEAIKAANKSGNYSYPDHCWQKAIMEGECAKEKREPVPEDPVSQPKVAAKKKRARKKK